MLETAVGGAAGGTIPVFMKLDQQFLLYSNKNHIVSIIGYGRGKIFLKLLPF